MKASAIDTEIQNINNEIATLVVVRERLESVRDRNGEVVDAPKTRKPRRKKGLPSATPPASEANLLGKL